MMATLIFRRSCASELRLRHLEAAVTDDRPYVCIGAGELAADRRRQPEPHRSEAAGRDE
jgi:hypothetical protein